MDLGLNGKLALVTASSGGIGLAIARALAQEGARVIVNGRSDETVLGAIAAIKEEVPEADLLPLAANAGTKEGCDTLIAAHADVDILVNNLGTYEANTFFDESDEEWQNLFETNIMSGVRLTRHYLRRMIDRDQGRVVFISSESGLVPAPEMTHYTATKTMQLAISRATAELTESTNVTVNSVLPGPTLTDGVERFIQSLYPGLSLEEAGKQFIKDNRPDSIIQRLLDPREIGEVVAFVVSERASAINGSNILAEGGLVRSIA